MSSTNTTHNDADYDVDLTGPDDGGWYYTQVMDWIALCPTLTNTSVRLYLVMRSLCVAKRAPVRRLSLDELRQLVPGPNGKTYSRRPINEAIGVLKDHGLIVALDSPREGGPVRWRVNDYPAEGDGYDGPRNTFAALEGLRDPDTRSVMGKRREQEPGEAGASSDQHAPVDNPDPGGRVVRKTAHPMRKTAQGVRKKAHTTPATQGKHDTQEGLQEVLQEPPSIPLRKEVQTAREDTSTEGRTEHPQPAPGDDVSALQNGSDTPSEVRRKAAGALLGALLPYVPSGSVPSTAAKRALVDAVLTAWHAGVSSRQVQAELLRDMQGVHSIAGVWETRLAALCERARVGTGVESEREPLPPRCGQCDAVYDTDPVSARMVTDDTGRDVRCPRCHPRADEPVVYPLRTAETPLPASDEARRDAMAAIRRCTRQERSAA